MSKKGSIRLGLEANSVEYLAMALEDFAAVVRACDHSIRLMCAAEIEIGDLVIVRGVIVGEVLPLFRKY